MGESSVAHAGSTSHASDHRPLCECCARMLSRHSPNVLYTKHDMKCLVLWHAYPPAHTGYLGAILFEKDLEQPLLGQTVSVTSLVDLEGAAFGR